MSKNITIGFLALMCLTLTGTSIYGFKKNQRYQILLTEEKSRQENCNATLKLYADKRLENAVLKNIEHDLTAQPIISHWPFIHESLAGNTSDQVKNERIIGYLSGRILVLETPQDLSIIANPKTTLDDIKKMAETLAQSGDTTLQSTAFKEGILKGTRDALLELHNRLKLLQSHKQ